MLRARSLVDDFHHDFVHEQARNLKHSWLEGIGWGCFVLGEFGGAGAAVMVTSDDETT